MQTDPDLIFDICCIFGFKSNLLTMYASMEEYTTLLKVYDNKVQMYPLLGAKASEKAEKHCKSREKEVSL